MSKTAGVHRRGFSALSVVMAMIAATVVSVLNASSAAAAVPPVVQRPAGAVTADALPTAQINGVVWSIAVNGNTVYAGGDFSKARPAGSAPGQNEVTRTNLLAFNATTGALTAFAPTFNAKVKNLALSPDGTRLYAGGAFTTVNGANRYRVAAFDTATGALVANFAPAFNATVTAISASNSAVYVGGWFSNVGGVGRNRLAAVNPSNGALLAWAPTADADVDSITLTPDKTKVVIGGKFERINGAASRGMGSVNATTGASEQWLMNSVVRSGGPTASVLTLKVDATAVYGSAFSFGSGNFEGTFSANPANGAINWLGDCHGDVYDSTSVNGVVYNAGHAHFCANIGGFPDSSNPRVLHHTMAFTKNANGTVLTNTQTGGHYANFGGQPAPSIIDWFPKYQIGTFTGQSQAAWSMGSNATYVIAGGEFLAVNGKSQQGLVRYAIPGASTNKIGPELSGGSWAPTASRTTNSIRVTWPANVDRDDLNLSYSVFRSDRGSSPVYTGTSASTLWNRPSTTFTDTSYAPSTSYTYFVRATDPSGNQATSSSVSITSPSSGGTPQNPPPVASYVWSASGLGASFNGTGSTDNGSITSYSWNYGDGTSGTGSTSSHTYGAAGSYQVTLTVTDNGGATNQITKTVTVGSSPPADSFTRNLSGTWGSADSGGPWSLSAAGSFSVNGSTGNATLGAANANLSAFLNAVSVQNVNISVQVAVNKVATGSGSQAMVVARRGDGSDYRFKVRYLATGGMNVVLSRVTAGVETSLGEVAAGTTYSAGQAFKLRMTVTGSGTTTISGKVWPASGSEPAAAQITRTDATPALQDAGAVGLIAYLSSNVTNAPVVVSVDNLLVT